MTISHDHFVNAQQQDVNNPIKAPGFMKPLVMQGLALEI